MAKTCTELGYMKTSFLFLVFLHSETSLITMFEVGSRLLLLFISSKNMKIFNKINITLRS